MLMRREARCCGRLAPYLSEVTRDGVGDISFSDIGEVGYAHAGRRGRCRGARAGDSIFNTFLTLFSLYTTCEIRDITVSERVIE